MILFNSLDDIRSHIERDIEEHAPDRVLIIGGGGDFYDSILSALKSSEGKTGISSDNIFRNQNNSLNWLCSTTHQVREAGRKAILISNYPRETDPPSVKYISAGERCTVEMPIGTSLRLSDSKDTATLVAVYLIGIYSRGYIEGVYASQAQGRETLTRFQVLVAANELYRSIPEEERNYVISASDGVEQQRALEELSSALDIDPEISFSSVVFLGGILVR